MEVCRDWSPLLSELNLLFLLYDAGFLFDTGCLATSEAKQDLCPVDGAALRGTGSLDNLGMAET